MENNIINDIKGKLVVSCQARTGWPMEGAEIMAAFASAAEVGGASMIRATGSRNILAIQCKTKLPILGINKNWVDSCDIYITPTIEDAIEVLQLGIEMIALDIRQGKRPGNQDINQILTEIRTKYPKVIIVGEIDDVDCLQYINMNNIDMISTTLKGYTDLTRDYLEFDVTLIEEIKQYCDKPIVAEGKINTPEEAKLALESGAHCVVVGTAITIPERITKRFVEAIS